MKSTYIRVENEIFEVSEKDRMSFNEAEGMPNKTGYIVNSKFVDDLVIKDKSENLEDLIEGYMLIDGRGDNPKTFHYFSLEDLKIDFGEENLIEKGIIVYGLVFDDISRKPVIVATLNKKGELKVI